MALSDPYVSAAEYRERYENLASDKDPEILEDATAISRYIEERTGRCYNNTGTAQARTFHPYRSDRFMYVDDIADPANVLIQMDDGRGGWGDAWAATDFHLKPFNASLEPTPRPYDEIFIPYWSAQGGFSTSKLYQVTAIFGWPAVPPQVKSACLELTAILRLETPRATNRYDDMGIQVGLSAKARNIIESLLSSVMPELSF